MLPTTHPFGFDARRGLGLAGLGLLLGCFQVPEDIPSLEGESTEAGSTGPGDADSSDGVDPTDDADGSSGSGETGDVDPDGSTGEPPLEPMCGDGVPAPGEVCYGAEPPLLDLGAPTTGVWAADLDGDGDADGMVLTPSSVVVVLNDGSGTLTVDDTYPLAEGAQTRDVAGADMDGDGWVDAVVTHDSPPGVQVMLNDGGGALAVPIETPLSYVPYAVATGDLDDDGHQDAVVSNEVGLAVLMGRGNGTFSAPERTTVAGYDSGRGVVIADLDGGGSPHVAVAFPGALAIFATDDRGGLSEPIVLEVPTSVLGPQDVAAGDVSADGLVDLVLADEADDTLRVLIGAGDGTFSLDPTARSGSFAVVGRADDDAESDVFSRTSEPTTDALAVYLGGEGSLSARPHTVVMHEGMVDMDGADFDGDGLTDILFALGDRGRIGLALSQP